MCLPKSTSAVFLFPPEPIAIRDLELGHLGRNVQNRNSPRKEIPQELSLGESRNGNDDSPRKPEFLGNGEFPRNEGPEIKGIKKGMHNLATLMIKANIYVYVKNVTMLRLREVSGLATRLLLRLHKLLILYTCRCKKCYYVARLCIPVLDFVPAGRLEYAAFLGFRQDTLEYNHSGARLMCS